MLWAWPPVLPDQTYRSGCCFSVWIKSAAGWRYGKCTTTKISAFRAELNIVRDVELQPNNLSTFFDIFDSHVNVGN